MEPFLRRFTTAHTRQASFSRMPSGRQPLKAPVVAHTFCSKPARGRGGGDGDRRGDRWGGRGGGGGGVGEVRELVPLVDGGFGRKGVAGGG